MCHKVSCHKLFCDDQVCDKAFVTKELVTNNFVTDKFVTAMYPNNYTLHTFNPRHLYSHPTLHFLQSVSCILMGAFFLL